METLVFETALGHTAFAHRSGRVQALSFGHSSEREALKALSRTLTNDSPIDYYNPDSAANSVKNELVDRLRAFAEGVPDSFSDSLVDASYLTLFGKKVTAACRQIPWGETRTYGELACQVGHPGAARAVGSVMARNRIPLIIPCHRVVPASGGLGGFSAPQGVVMKKRLLGMENAGRASSAKR